MTLSIAWIRTLGSVQELLFASDSRLRAGQAWDCCPKIMTLPRSDCLISFAGETDYAYPLMIQMARAIEFYPPSFNRRVDVGVVKDRAINIFNQMRGLIHDFPGFQTTAGDPRTGFIFGGYSWREQQFRIWKLQYWPQNDAFGFHSIPNWPGQSGTKVIAFAGDEIKEAHTRLVALLRQREKLQSGDFDMEPFEVLRDMIRSAAYPTIGGAPQVAKVYRFLQTQYFAVRWPTGQDIPHILGRPALNYERLGAPSIDPDAPAIQTRSQLSRYNQEAVDASALPHNYDAGNDPDQPESDDYSQ
jgi:hypothetical protein